MDGEVDEPVRGDHQRGADRRLFPLRREPDDRAEKCRPDQCPEQAVRIGHVMEVHRVHRGDAGDDPHRLDPRDQQDGKADVDELRGDEQRSEPRRPRAGRRDQRRGEVTDEHGASLSRRGMTSSATALDRGGAKGPKQGA